MRDVNDILRCSPRQRGVAIKSRCSAESGLSQSGVGRISRLPRSLTHAASASAIALALASCSSPATPTPSPSVPLPTTPVLMLTGGTVLPVGLTTPLTAKNAAGAVVTAGLTWQSQAVTVATVSAAGLVMAGGGGTTTIPAASSDAIGSVSVVVEPLGSGTTQISACMTITMPGSYVISADLPGATNGCLRLSSVSAVELDCRGHAVGGLFLVNVSNTTVMSCSMTGQLSLTNVNGVTVTNCTVGNTASVTSGTAVMVANSRVSARSTASAAVSVSSSTNVTLVQDTVTFNATIFGDGVAFDNGMNDQVLQSTITGAYNDGPAEVGTDDGILLANEMGETIQGNTISQFFDTAVEGVGNVANTTIANNTFTHIGIASIGAYHCTNWTGNVIRGNTVSIAPELMRVSYDTSQCQAPIPSPGFSGNQIMSNVLRDPILGITAIVGLASPGPAVVVDMTGTVAGNLLQNNDFGTRPGPYLSPLAGFADGGGNICGPANPASVIPNFVCTAGGGFAVRSGSDLPTRLGLALSRGPMV